MGIFSGGSKPASSRPDAFAPSPSPAAPSLHAPVCRHDILFDSEGRICNWNVVRRAVQLYGVADDPVSRRILYPFLLGVFAVGSTKVERAVVLRRLRHVHAKLVFVCEKFSEEMAEAREATGAQEWEESGMATGLEGAATPTETCTPRTSKSSPSTPGFIRVANGQEGSMPSSGVQQTSRQVPNSYASFAEAHRLIVIDVVRTDLLDLQEYGDWDESVFWGTVFGAGATRNDRDGARNGRGKRGSYPVVGVGDGLPELMQVHSPLPKPSQQVRILRWFFVGRRRF